MTLCGSCGQEIRFGWRDGLQAWWHRDEVDHHAVLGQRFTAEMQAEVERQLDLPRTRPAPGVASHCQTYQRLWPEEVYTAREHELERYRKNLKFREQEARETEDDIEVEPPPPAEVPSYDVTAADLPPRSGMRQVVTLLQKTEGWDIRSLTASRGPYLGAKGQILSISDSILVKAVDKSGRWVVGFWRDGKFDFSYAGVGARLHRKINATEMKDWIKGNDLPPNPSTSHD